MVLPGNRSIIISPGNFTASPKSPLDMKFPSPGRSKRYDNGGIGLGIVAELEKSGIFRINRHQISPRQNLVCYSESGSNRFNSVHCARRFQFPAEIEIDLSEEYTCVTSRDGVTRVYYNDGEFEFCQNRSDSDRRWDKSMDIADKSPAKKREVLRDTPYFLSLCCLCKKKLQGKDIYMYKGDKGFCSVECRSVNILEENLNVQQKSASVEFLNSPSAGRKKNSAGIFVI
ncbi:hypothetical protein EUTSA_v10008681mg [Eutrema salsugineum]|uniref:FLZ-type domain-containing protein n=2 Tax=Eutrema salsugineum TaxID=72664 RepID=V4KXW3_EUTSA|nr:hypothetical protein EUTSA_v10008681mg [Eutrema salsugineum]